jgi:adenylate cyclase
VSAADRFTILERSEAAQFSYTVDRHVDRDARTADVDAARLLALMSDIARSLMKNQPLSNVLEEVVRLALESSTAWRGTIILRDEKTGELVPRVVRSRSGSEQARGVVSRTILNRVITDRVAILAANAQNDSRFAGAQSLSVQNVGSLMCAPLWSQERTIGALLLDTPEREQFSPVDLELLVALSNYAAVAIEQARLAGQVSEEARRRERLGRYHSPAVVAQILESGGDADAPFMAQEREVSVLFADIVGFTSLSERLAPQKVASILNNCFTRLSDVLFEYGGTLDKFIGDGLLAVFGAPLDQPDHAVRAVRAAKAMRRAMLKLNQESNEAPLLLRIAVNSGTALAGDIGSPRRREYTVLGDVVNTASRVEATATEPGQIVITRPTYDRLSRDMEAKPLGPVTLRGRRQPVELFEVEPEARPKLP